MPRKLKYTYEYVCAFLKGAGYTLLSSYNGTRERIKVRCPKGHISNIWFSNFHTHGNRCFECYGSKKYNIEFIREYAISEGYVLKSDIYERAGAKLEFMCPKKHIYRVSWEKFYRRGFRCSFCSGKYGGLNIEIARERFMEAGYTLLDVEYESATHPMEFKCGNGHTHKMNLNNLSRGQRCGKCYEEFENGRSSRPERQIESHLSKMGITFSSRDRGVIAPYELDFYFPEHKVALEYCGLYWHSDAVGKPRNYHYKKMVACREKGIRLITVFEDEFLMRPSVVLSRFFHSLGVSQKVIYARKCDVIEVGKKEARAFMEENHLQGSGAFKIAYGLCFEGELVGVLTGGSIGRKHVSAGKNIIELKRLAFSPGVVVVGGASRLFKRFKTHCVNNGYEEIRSYCDMRYGNPFNPIYEKLGFTFLTESKYTPHYFKGQKRYRNYSLRKTPEERLTGKTEWELREAQGYRRIWDCGHRTYVLNLKKGCVDVG